MATSAGIAINNTTVTDGDCLMAMAVDGMLDGNGWMWGWARWQWVGNMFSDMFTSTPYWYSQNRGLFCCSLDRYRSTKAISTTLATSCSAANGMPPCTTTASPTTATSGRAMSQFARPAAVHASWRMQKPVAGCDERHLWDTWVEMGLGHVCGHVYEHVYGHVYRHV